SCARISIATDHSAVQGTGHSLQNLDIYIKSALAGPFAQEQRLSFIRLPPLVLGTQVSNRLSFTRFARITIASVLCISRPTISSESGGWELNDTNEELRIEII